MHQLLWRESSKITDFAIRKGMTFVPYTPTVFSEIPGYDHQLATKIGVDVTTNRGDVYIALAKIA